LADKTEQQTMTTANKYSMSDDRSDASPEAAWCAMKQTQTGGRAENLIDLCQALQDMWFSGSIEKHFCFSVNLFNPKEFIF
jgi:hypothetical protein